MQRGIAAVKARNTAEAAQWFEKAWQEKPQDFVARAWLGQSLCSLGRHEEGTVHLLEAGKGFLRNARGTKDLAQVLEVAGQLQHWSDFSGALELLREAVEIKPEEFRGHQMLAVTYAQLNKRDEALAAGDEALKLSPTNHMMQVFQGSLEADAGRNQLARERLEKVLTERPGSREAFRAHKELARVLDRLGAYEKVFAHLHASGVLSRSLPEYVQQDATLIPDIVKANRAGFDRNLMGRWASTKFPSDQPAPNFIIGFMRSGTTLTQEVLDAHPDVFVADEIDLISAVKRELHAMDRSSTHTADILGRIDLTGILHLREFYWAKVRERFGDSVGARVFVDKFTMNTVDLGLINCVFPDAKVVFLMRDPRDVCLSCFMQLMVPTPTTVHLLTWQGTAAFYEHVMAWWMYAKDQITLQLIDLRYEDVVANFEATFRRVFAFLGVPWNDAVADFHKHAARKFVATPSRVQVTQPLYASSVGRWRNFESDFAPVLPCLNQFIKAFGYDEVAPAHLL